MEDKEKVDYIQIFFNRITDRELDLMTHSLACCTQIIENLQSINFSSTVTLTETQAHASNSLFPALPLPLLSTHLYISFPSTQKYESELLILQTHFSSSLPHLDHSAESWCRCQSLLFDVL